MSDWSLARLLANVHDDIQQRLSISRGAFGHAPTKGDASETVWLELLQKYLDIEQTRFGPRLAVQMTIDPETLDALVPNFMLQPLVENAVRHGIAPHSRPGRITISAGRDGERLTIHIVDSGNGVAPHRLTLLNQGVGLANTRARLEHLYRDSHALVFSNVEGGFRVTVSIPFVVAGFATEPVEAGVA